MLEASRPVKALKVEVKGTWPTSGAPVVEVHLWDVSSAAMALPQLATDPDAATFCVALEGSEALQLAKDCR